MSLTGECHCSIRWQWDGSEWRRTDKWMCYVTSADIPYDYLQETGRLFINFFARSMTMTVLSYLQLPRWQFAHRQPTQHMSLSLRVPQEPWKIDKMTSKVKISPETNLCKETRVDLPQFARLITWAWITDDFCKYRILKLPYHQKRTSCNESAHCCRGKTGDFLVMWQFVLQHWPFLSQCHHFHSGIAHQFLSLKKWRSVDLWFWSSDSRMRPDQ